MVRGRETKRVVEENEWKTRYKKRKKLLRGNGRVGEKQCLDQVSGANLFDTI